MDNPPRGDTVVITALQKKYKEVEALKGVTLTVPRGKIFGLLGPNGAGKTTLIKAMVGAVRPTGGTVRVLGQDPLRSKDTLRRRIGYMPQAPALYEDLSARENISFFGRVHSIDNLAERVDAILGFTELTERADDPVHTFSGGMKKRVSLACALVHEPELLFLDEPTAAVDPYLRNRSWALFRELADRGVTLIISTHLMDEALHCDTLAILREGRLLAVDTPERFLEQGPLQVTIRQDGHTFTFSTQGGSPKDLAEALRPYGLSGSIESIRVVPPSLESIFLSLIERQK